jgi:hypothetical protein
MKKLIMSLAAILTFGIASAQIDPEQPQQTQPDPVKGVEPDSKNKADRDVDVPIDPQTIETRKDKDPLKDELKTKDHVKSTPDPAVVKDEKDEEEKPRDKRKKKRRN